MKQQHQQFLPRSPTAAVESLVKHNDHSLVNLLEQVVGLKVDLLPISIQQTKQPQSSGGGGDRFLSNSDIMEHISKIGSVGDKEIYAPSIGAARFSINFTSVKTFEPLSGNRHGYTRPINKISETNKITIDIKYFMKTSTTSPKEIVQQLGVQTTMGNNNNIGSSIEESILNKYIEIIDTDFRRKQVYFKIKTGIEKNDGELYERFVIIGKFDSTNYGFIFDMSMFSKSPPTSIEQFYKVSTPNEFKNKCKKPKKGQGGVQYADKKEAGIRRVGLSSFMISSPPASIRLKRENERNIVWAGTGEWVFKSPLNKNYGAYITSTRYFGGEADFGFFQSFLSKGGYLMGLSSGLDCYTNSLIQEISN